MSLPGVSVQEAVDLLTVVLDAIFHFEDLLPLIKDLRVALNFVPVQVAVKLHQRANIGFVTQFARSIIYIRLKRRFGVFPNQ